MQTNHLHTDLFLHGGKIHKNIDIELLKSVKVSKDIDFSDPELIVDYREDFQNETHDHKPDPETVDFTPVIEELNNKVNQEDFLSVVEELDNKVSKTGDETIEGVKSFKDDIVLEPTYGMQEISLNPNFPSDYWRQSKNWQDNSITKHEIYFYKPVSQEAFNAIKTLAEKYSDDPDWYTSIKTDRVEISSNQSWSPSDTTDIYLKAINFGIEYRYKVYKIDCNLYGISFYGVFVDGHDQGIDMHSILGPDYTKVIIDFKIDVSVIIKKPIIQNFEIGTGNLLKYTDGKLEINPDEIVKSDALLFADWIELPLQYYSASSLSDNKLVSVKTFAKEGYNNYGIMYSNDGCLTWNESIIPTHVGSPNIYTKYSSAGRYILVNWNRTKIYFSNNYGASFSIIDDEIPGEIDINPYVSASGQYMSFVKDGITYISKNAGSTFSPLNIELKNSLSIGAAVNVVLPIDDLFDTTFANVSAGFTLEMIVTKAQTTNVCLLDTPYGIRVEQTSSSNFSINVYLTTDGTEKLLTANFGWYDSNFSTNYAKLVIVYNGTTLSVYNNKTLINSLAVSGALTATNNKQLGFTNTVTNTKACTARIIDVKLWSTVLSQEEFNKPIQDYVNLPNNLVFCTNIPIETGPIFSLINNIQPITFDLTGLYHSWTTNDIFKCRPANFSKDFKYLYLYKITNYLSTYWELAIYNTETNTFKIISSDDIDHRGDINSDDSGRFVTITEGENGQSRALISHDFGETFTEVNLLSNAPNSENKIEFIFNDGTLLLRNYDSYDGNMRTFLHKSTDLGQTWNNLGFPDFSGTIYSNSAKLVTLASDNIFYIIIKNTLFYSKNYGVDWSQISTNIHVSISKVNLYDKNSIVTSDGSVKYINIPKIKTLKVSKFIEQSNYDPNFEYKDTYLINKGEIKKLTDEKLENYNGRTTVIKEFQGDDIHPRWNSGKVANLSKNPLNLNILPGGIFQYNSPYFADLGTVANIGTRSRNSSNVYVLNITLTTTNIIYSGSFLTSHAITLTPFKRLTENDTEFILNDGTVIYDALIFDNITYSATKVGNYLIVNQPLKYLPSVNNMLENSSTLKRYYVYGYNGNDVIEAKNTDNYKNYGVLYNGIAGMELHNKLLTDTDNNWFIPSSDELQAMLNHVSKTLGVSWNELHKVIKSSRQVNNNFYKPVLMTMSNGIKFYDVNIDPSKFNNNLDKNVTTLKSLAERVDKFNIPIGYLTNDVLDLLKLKDNKKLLIDYIKEYNLSINYGYLYNWYTIEHGIDSEAKLTSSDDWKVPTQADYTTLFTSIGAGHLDKLKTVDKWVTPGTNDFGFNLVPGGIRSSSNGTFSMIDEQTNYWTIDEDSSTTAFAVNFTDTVQTVNNIHKYTGASIRLVREASVEEQLLSDGTKCAPYIGNDLKTYDTVKIGTQVWLAYNLCETKFRNNTDGILIEVNNDWATQQYYPKYCSYNNNHSSAYVEEIKDVNLSQYATKEELNINIEDSINWDGTNHVIDLSISRFYTLKVNNGVVTLNFSVNFPEDANEKMREVIVLIDNSENASTIATVNFTGATWKWSAGDPIQGLAPGAKCELVVRNRNNTTVKGITDIES